MTERYGLRNPRHFFNQQRRFEVAILAINTDRTSSHTLDMRAPSERYTLSAEHVEDAAVRLNGNILESGSCGTMRTSRAMSSDEGSR